MGKRLLRRGREEIRAEARVDEARLHDLRHTFAATLLEDGVRLKTVQYYLGHSTVAMTADL